MAAPTAEADHGVFGNGAVVDSSGELFGEAFCGFECAAEFSDVLAVEEHARVLAQEGDLRFADGVDVGYAHDSGTWENLLESALQSSR